MQSEQAAPVAATPTAGSASHSPRHSRPASAAAAIGVGVGASAAAHPPHHHHQHHQPGAAPPVQPSHQQMRALGVAWPDAHPHALTPAHADRPQHELRSEAMQMQMQQSAAATAAASAAAASAGAGASPPAHALHSLRSALPGSAHGAQHSLVPSPSSSAGGSSAGNSPGLSAHSHNSLAALHSSTSHLLATFNNSGSGSGGSGGTNALTPAKAKLNQFILDLVKNQIKITGQTRTCALQLAATRP